MIRNALQVHAGDACYLSQPATRIRREEGQSWPDKKSATRSRGVGTDRTHEAPGE